MNRVSLKLYLRLTLVPAAAVFVALAFVTIAFTGCIASNAARADGKTGGAVIGAVIIDRYEELIRSPLEGRFTVFFPDLSVSPQAQDKSGDAAIVILPGGKVMMIDSGHPESAGDSLALLSDLGINKIDYFIITHPHIDHIGGFPAIAEKHEIGEVFQTALEYSTETYRSYRTALEKFRLPVNNLNRGDALVFGEGVTALVLNPQAEISYPANFPGNSTQFLNDNSLVIKFTWGASSILFGADIYLTRERELSELYGEELVSVAAKANHHGSDTSNSAGWIRAVQPKLVVAMDDQISSMTVYNNYKRSGAAYYHTFLDGIVRVSLDREGNYEVISRFDSWLRN